MLLFVCIPNSVGVALLKDAPEIKEGFWLTGLIPVNEIPVVPKTDLARGAKSAEAGIEGCKFMMFEKTILLITNVLYIL